MYHSIGRADDVIMLASGEKTVPAPMEGIIGSSPFVQGVLMFGRERNQVGIIVEPRPEHAVDTRDDNAIAEFRNKIWYVSRPTLGRYADRDAAGGSSRKRTRPHQHSVEYSRK